jgi:hypothetical protein
MLVKRNVRYELTTIDNNFKRAKHRFFVFWGTLFDHFVRGSAVTKAEISFHQKKKLQPFETQISVNQPGFSVANVADNKPVAEDAVFFRSEALAREYMNQQILANPNQAKSMHVIPQYEISE